VGLATPDDIQETDGIQFIRITDEGKDQTLKIAGSRRRVPGHSCLIRLGFLDYVKSIKKAGHERLFPQLRQGANGFSDPAGKYFGRLVTKCGLTDPALVLHSFRHGEITRLHAAGAQHNIVLMLAGHSAQGVHDQVYVHREGLPLSLLKEALEKLRYDGVVKVLTV
jgi:integrase